VVGLADCECDVEVGKLSRRAFGFHGCCVSGMLGGKLGKRAEEKKGGGFAENFACKVGFQVERNELEVLECRMLKLRVEVYDTSGGGGR
jgi:hypothetical protein